MHGASSLLINKSKNPFFLPRNLYEDSTLSIEANLDSSDLNAALDIVTSIRDNNPKALIHILALPFGLPHLSSHRKRCMFCNKKSGYSICCAEIITKRKHKITTIASNVTACKNKACGFMFLNNEQLIEFIKNARKYLT